jgi:hypothetical protein
MNQMTDPSGERIQRRELLAAGVAATLGGAGCVEAGGDASPLTNAPAAVLLQYYHAADQADNLDEFVEQVAGIVHSASTFDRRIETDDRHWTEARAAEIKTVAVIEENLGDEQLVDRVGFLGANVLPLYGEGLSAEIDAIAGRNAVVRVTLSAGDAVEEASHVRQWLLATDDGRWRLVWE